MDKINLDDYEEINEEEYYEYGGAKFLMDFTNDDYAFKYFKKKSKDVFEDLENSILSCVKGHTPCIHTDCCLEKDLIKIFEEAKRRRGKR